MLTWSGHAQGILLVLHTGISWEHLREELGFGSGMTCWCRLAGTGSKHHPITDVVPPARGKRGAGPDADADADRMWCWPTAATTTTSTAVWYGISA